MVLRNISQKKSIAVIMSLLLTLVLSGCSTGATGTTSEQEYNDEIYEDNIDDYETEADDDLSSYDFDGSIGPLTCMGTIEDGFVVNQYDIGDGELKEVFSFSNTGGYKTTVNFDINAMPAYQLREIFDADMSKLAVYWNDSEDNSWRVGWIDRNGNLTDITEKIHPTTSDFSSVVPYDSSPIFTPDGQFMFADHNAEKYVYVDVDSLEVVKEEDVMRDETWKNPKWDVVFLPDGTMAELMRISADYGSFDFGEYLISVRKTSGWISGLAAYDFIDTGVAVGIGRYGDWGSNYCVAKYGVGITELDEYNTYSWDEETDVNTKLTPDTDFTLERCTYGYGKIAFTGHRGDERKLFFVNDGSGEQAVETVTDLSSDEYLLFWK